MPSAESESAGEAKVGVTEEREVGKRSLSKLNVGNDDKTKRLLARVLNANRNAGSPMPASPPPSTDIRVTDLPTSVL